MKILQSFIDIITKRKEAKEFLKLKPIVDNGTHVVQIDAIRFRGKRITGKKLRKFLNKKI